MPLCNTENPFVYFTGYWAAKYIKYFEARWPVFFPSEGINISAPQLDSGKPVNHVNHNIVERTEH